MKQELLSRAECTAMRGIAILAIVLHNYCHFIGKIVKENEYQFFTSNNDGLWRILTNPDELLPVHLLSFFGHYGVPVFLFLSGLGLVKKYEQGDKVATLPFIRYNYLKLLRMLIVGFSLFIIVDILTPGRFHFHWYNVVAQLLMYINVLPTPDKIIWPGIYWFFGLMIQLYIVYRLFLYRQKSIWVVALIAICWLLQAFCDPEGETLNRLRYNFIGGMLPFGLGILFARIPIFRSLTALYSFDCCHEFLVSKLVLRSCVYYHRNNLTCKGYAKVDAQRHHMDRRDVCSYVCGTSHSSQTLYYRSLETGYLRRTDALHHCCDSPFVGC